MNLNDCPYCLGTGEVQSPHNGDYYPCRCRPTPHVAQPEPTKPTLVQFPDRCGDIPAMLRRLADNIESGTVYGKVLACAVVCDGDQLTIHGYGTATSVTTHYMFALGQRKIENGTLEARDGA